MRARSFDPEVTEEIIRRYRDGEAVLSIVAGFTARGHEMTVFDAYQTLRDADVPRTQRRRARVVDIPGMEGFVDRYKSGESVKRLADEAGVAFSTMRANLVKAGLEIGYGYGRPRIELPNLEGLAKRHAEGESVRSLAREIGVSHMTLKRRLADASKEK